MLSTTTEYALRALVHMAQLPPASSILGRNLAKQADIPADYLSKLLWTLRKAGFVEAFRGQGGGYRLSKPANRIPLVEIVELFEGIHSRPGCLLGERHECSDEQACTAHNAWKEVRQVYLHFLTQNTIADLLHNRSGKPPAAAADRRKRVRQPSGGRRP